MPISIPHGAIISIDIAASQGDSAISIPHGAIIRKSDYDSGYFESHFNSTWCDYK